MYLYCQVFFDVVAIFTRYARTGSTRGATFKLAYRKD